MGKKWIVAGAGALSAFILLSQTFTFGWLPTSASEYIGFVIRLRAEKSGNVSPLYMSTDVVPLTRPYADCRQWMFENFWSDCAAVWVSDKILARGGIENVRDSVLNACQLIEGAGPGYFGSDVYPQLRSFFSCGTGRYHSTKVFIYTDRGGGNSIERLGAIEFPR